MKITVYLALILALTACGKKKSLNGIIPKCIISEMQNDSTLVVKVQYIKGQAHYWLNTGASTYDGNEYIVNAKCEVVCKIPVWFMEPCFSVYGPTWQLVRP